MTPIWGYVLSALGIIISALLAYLGVRFTQQQTRLANVDTDETEWGRRYRSNAERHLRWDLKILARLQKVEAQLGIDDEPIEDPPPLFPEPEK